MSIKTYVIIFFVGLVILMHLFGKLGDQAGTIDAPHLHITDYEQIEIMESE